MSDSSLSEPDHPGLRLRSPSRYDRMVWLFTWGRPHQFRAAMLKPAKLKKGESVLDVSCGTGSLALVAKELVGSSGRVHGVDASSEMITFAQAKAARLNADVSFHVAAAQELPFDNASFDVVVTTLALHHLPRPGREQLFREMTRVLRPGGRALAVDFAKSRKNAHGFLSILKPRHGAVDFAEITSKLEQAGLDVEQSGSIGTMNLGYVLARAGI